MKKTIVVILCFSTILCLGQTKNKKKYLTVNESSTFLGMKPSPEDTSPLTINGKILQHWSNRLATKEEALVYDKNRRFELKKIEVGDMVCAKEIYMIRKWDPNYLKFGRVDHNKVFWIREIKAFVEQTSKNKIQIKVADESEHWEGFIETRPIGFEVVGFMGAIEDIPFISNGIEIQKGNIYWIDAINDYRWCNCN